MQLQADLRDEESRASKAALEQKLTAQQQTADEKLQHQMDSNRQKTLKQKEQFDARMQVSAWTTLDWST